jgi:membrane protease YdiL (CAAX protease family)
MVPHGSSFGTTRRRAPEQDAPVSAAQLNLVVTAAFLAASILSVAMVVLVPLSAGMRRVRAALLANWRAAVAIAAVYEVASIVRGRALDLSTLAVLSWALVGLALARGIPGFEPLAVARAVRERRHPLRAVLLMLGLALVLNFVAKLAGGLGMSLGHALAGETARTAEVAATFPTDPVQSFFLLLGGAGIAEETLFRLVVLSLAWRLTRSPLLAIAIAALAFGAYHLSPLDGLYEQFWTFPVSQFLASTFTGLVWGATYVKRGYETAVLGHTLGDWLTILLFAR